MKKARLPVMIIGFIVLLTMPAVIQACSNEEGVIDVDTKATIPPLDLDKPALTETATFALG